MTGRNPCVCPASAGITEPKEKPLRPTTFLIDGIPVVGSIQNEHFFNSRIACSPDVSMTLGLIPAQDRDFFVAEVAELTDKWKPLEVAALKIRIQST